LHNLTPAVAVASNLFIFHMRICDADCCAWACFTCVLLCLRRFQSQLPGQAKYSSVLASLLMIQREEGLGALYKGFVPKALRLGIGQSVGLIMFEQVRGDYGVGACFTVAVLLPKGLCAQGAALRHPPKCWPGHV
jgi:hypothetical protein